MLVTEDACKKRWGNIRDQYKKHINKRKTKSGQGATIIKKYKYEDNLNFLLPHVQDRHTITSIENEQTQVSTDNEIEIIDTHQQQQQQPLANLQPSKFTPLTDPKPNPQETAQFTRSKNRNRRLIPQSQPSASTTLMEYIIKNNEKTKQDIHPIDAFFNGLAATIKKFSPYYQHLAKGKIFAVVQELEWEQLSAEPMSGTSSDFSSPVYTPLSIATPPTPTPPEPTPLGPTPFTSTAAILKDNMSTYFSEFTENNNNVNK